MAAKNDNVKLSPRNEDDHVHIHHVRWVFKLLEEEKSVLIS